MKITSVRFRYTVTGDAKCDRAAKIGGFSILASRFNILGTFSHASFNDSRMIAIDDLSILADTFDTTLPATRTPLPRLPARANAAPAVVSVVFNAQKIESIVDEMPI